MKHQEAKLEEAAERAKIKVVSIYKIEVDKQSITETPLD